MNLRFATEDTLEGLLVPYGGSFNGRDSYGTFASANTDFCLNWFPDGRPLLFHHGLMDDSVRTDPVGRMSLEVRSDGVWMSAVLDMHNQYIGDIKKLVDAGALGLSSGAMAHLVEIDEKTGEWKRWPIVEGSLTPAPSNLLATIDNYSFASACRSGGFEDIAEKLGESDVLTPSGIRTPEPPKDPTESQQKPTEPVSLDAVGRYTGTETRAAASTDSVSMEKSFEDIRDDIGQLINPPSPYYSDSYSYVVATYADSVIVCRCDGDGECTYWRTQYTLGADSDPILGDSVQVENVFVPVRTWNSTIPLSLDATAVTQSAALLGGRTKDLTERRIREGRILSTSNRTLITEACDAMDGAAAALRDLLTRTDGMAQEQARAAAVAAPEARRWMIDLLEFTAA